MVSESTTIVSSDPELLASRPFPVGIRDLGDRSYEVADEWSRVRIEDESTWTADMHQALREQAVTEAEGTLADELGRVEAVIRETFGADALLNVHIERHAGKVVTKYVAIACIGQNGEAVSGEGATAWEAYDDLRACAAMQLPATASVA